MTRIFYRGAHAVFLTYDITREETFTGLLDWLKEIRLHAAEDAKVYLIGNKAELEHDREIPQEMAIEFAQQNGISQVFETSAKTGFNVEEVFSCVGKELYMQVKEDAEKAKAEQQSSPMSPDGQQATKGKSTGKIDSLAISLGGSEKIEGGSGKKKGCC